MKRKVLLLIVGVQLLFGAAVSASFQIQTAKALIPSIVSVGFHDVGSTTWLDVEVTHQPPPAIGPSHYVSSVQLQVNGTTVDLTQTPQSTTTFTVQYQLGPNTNKYSVTARALCNVHGYSAYSNMVTVPEPIGPVLFMVLTAAAVLIAKKTLSPLGRTVTRNT